MRNTFTKEQFEYQREQRYSCEPEILAFTKFSKYSGARVLEIGVGLGADHQTWAEAGAFLHGIDLTARAIEITRKRFEIFELDTELQIADAENLPFQAETFDVVYSWGVLLYCPDMNKAVEEVRRVLRPGGVAIIMLYHKYSFVGYMLWLRYALLRFKPWLSLHYIYHNYLEAKGTQAFTTEEALSFFGNFKSVDIEINLSHGDLLSSEAGQRHRGILLTIARKIWPRSIIKRFFPGHGLFMKIRAVK